MAGVTVDSSKRMMVTILDPNTETQKVLDMEEVADHLQEIIAERETAAVVEAGEVILNPMSKMKEKERMAVVAAAGVVMMLEEAITGAEVAVTIICHLHNPTEVVAAVEAEEETDLQ